MPNSDPTLQPPLTDTPSPQAPRLKRLATKPLKLAQSTLHSLSRSSSSNHLPTQPTSSTSTSTSATTLLPESAIPNVDATPNKKKRFRRHVHLPGKKDSSRLTPSQVASAAGGPRKPLDGEDPAVVLRVRVVRAEGLVAKDRRGTSDPFVSLVIPPTSRQSTPVVKKTLDPTFPAESSTFDFPLYLSMAGVVGGRGLEGVMWDKDLMRKEYMGEMAVPLLDWFEGGDVKLWSEDLPVLKRKLLSTRRRHEVTGTVSLQIGFLPPKDISSSEDALKKVRRIYGAFVDQMSAGKGYTGILGVPAHEGIGTIKMRAPRGQVDQTFSSPATSSLDPSSARTLIHSATAAVLSPLSGGHRMVPSGSNQPIKPVHHDHDDDDDEEEDDDGLSDDGLSSSSSDDEFEDALTEEDGNLHDSPPGVDNIVCAMYDTTIGLPFPKPSDGKRAPSADPPKTAGLLAPHQHLTPNVKPAKTPGRQTSLPGYFDRPTRHDAAGETPLGTPGTSTPGGGKSRRPIFKRDKSRAASKRSTKRDFNFDANQGRETLGIVIMEIKGATDLPKMKNALRVSFDMDPFVVISFGKKIFRTRVIRHSLNPTWDEKLLFHVRRHENTFVTQFAVLDWDKVSGNDAVGTCTLPLSELIADAPMPDAKTGLYGEKEDGKHEMKEFTLPLSTDREMPWESKHSPKLIIRAKYEPYDALRQRFWRQYITQYDTDDTGALSYFELTAMLDSLGSTLTKQTIEGYFTSCGKDLEKDELTSEEVVFHLETETKKDRSQKAKVADNADGLSGANTPVVAAQPASHGLGYTGPDKSSQPVDAKELADHIRHSQPRGQGGEFGLAKTAGNIRPINIEKEDSTSSIPSVRVRTATVPHVPDMPPSRDGSELATPLSGSSDVEGDESPDDRERIINIRTCPLCHRPRLGKRSEQDIVTHLAICASADWSRVDKIVTANYVTSSQAQRKFFTRIVNKVAIGSYSLGANSGNILVQDRRTGQLQEEKMAVYVRLGIRVLYKGAKGHMEGSRARRLLKSLSIKQGIKYDSPSSALDIPAFIAFHNLDTNEILDPIHSFKSFNEFFYRKLKADARPVDEPGNAGRMVSCADCRMMAFESVGVATDIWIKGREFSMGRLLGNEYAGVVEKFEGGALGIFRLAPQDYHRFHSPVKGRIGKMTMIDGEYYTVNPQAIRTTLDVYGENVRMVVPIETEEFGTVMTVWVGAMMVGSILTTVKEGQMVDRADELGYFAFGGSTIICLFEKGVLEWDEDLISNGRSAIETLVRMGSGLGRSVRGKIGVNA